MPENLAQGVQIALVGSEKLCFTTFVFLVTSVADHDRPFCTIQALKNVAPAEQIRFPDVSHFEIAFGNHELSIEGGYAGWDHRYDVNKAEKLMVFHI